GGSGGSGGSSIDAPPGSMPDAETPDTLPFCGGGGAHPAHPAGGGRFLFFSRPQSWCDAVTPPSRVGAHRHLPPLRARHEDLIAQTLNGQTLAWIGYDDRTVEGQFNWITSEVSGYTDWGTGQPNNGAGGTPQNCVVLDPGLQDKWNDKACADQYGYICEREGQPM